MQKEIIDKSAAQQIVEWYQSHRHRILHTDYQIEHSEATQIVSGIMKVILQFTSISEALDEFHLSSGKAMERIYSLANHGILLC